MGQKITTPDVRQLKDDKLPQAEFPGGRDQAFRVFFEPAAHDGIWQHARADTSVEICGVLVGVWGRDAAGPFVTITASIRGDAATNKFAEVTFTHETWSKINSEMDSKYADRSIVGWYHTHPDFGIFLSDRDRFIQENFFSGPGQIAYVVDPIRKIEGVFTWQSGKPELAQSFWVGNRVLGEPPAASGSVSHPGEATASVGAATSAGMERKDVISGDWLAMLHKVATYLLVFLVGWLLSGRINDFMIDRARLEGVVLTYFQLGLKPELELRLRELQIDAEQTAGLVSALRSDHLERLKKSEASEKDVEAVSGTWKEAEDRLGRMVPRLQLIEQQYCLSPSERETLRSLIQAAQARDLQRSEKPTEKRTKPPDGGGSPKSDKSADKKD